MTPIETDRLRLRRLTPDDAAFIFELVNEPSWLQYIGDKGVRTLDDARDYIRNGPATMYVKHGFGLYVVERKSDGAPTGLCGLIKRDTLDDVDIGYAFLPAYWGRGYAREAATATLVHGRDDFGLRRIVAITSQDNHDSIRLLENVGFVFERLLRLANDPEEVKLFAYWPG